MKRTFRTKLLILWFVFLNIGQAPAVFGPFSDGDCLGCSFSSRSRSWFALILLTALTRIDGGKLKPANRAGIVAKRGMPNSARGKIAVYCKAINPLGIAAVREFHIDQAVFSS